MGYYWLLAILAALAISFSGFYHIVTTKRDVRAAIGWSAVVWLVPFLGVLFYFLFGINRLERKAARVKAGIGKTASAISRGKIKTALAPALSKRPEVQAHIRLMDSVSEFPFVPGNRIRVLDTGKKALGEMLEAIKGARESIGLQTFIFDFDEAGKKFVEALETAQARGVEVRVLMDTIGALYYRPSIVGVLKGRKIPVSRFNPSLVPWRMSYLNLRNHRKILVVDGRLAFTGGMNIRAGNYDTADPKKAIRDLHFSLQGPVVAQMMDVFAHDWAFATRETLKGAKWFPKPVHFKGVKAFARGIPDGPDGDVKKTRWAIFSALGMARKSVKIMTPYFLPDRILVSALNHSALRGVSVEILLPEKNNLWFVQWASKAQYNQVLEGGCKIYHSKGAFDHSKAVIIDNAWCLIGSTNWDPRSFRLNFEFNVECFNPSLARKLGRLVDGKMAKAEEITLTRIKAQSRMKRAFHGFVWLFSPYL